MKQEERANLKQEILDAAWELFDKKGYEKTTVNEIIEKAGTSKGGFYYYFKAKEELLNSLYAIFDREYEKMYEAMDKNHLDSMMQLKLLHQHVSYFIETNVSPSLLAEMYRSQLMQKQQESFWGEDRYYMRLVKKIILEGQEKGEIRNNISADELTHHVLMLERGILVDWCVQNGGFPLGYRSERCFSLYTEFMKPVK